MAAQASRGGARKREPQTPRDRKRPCEIGCPALAWKVNFFFETASYRMPSPFPHPTDSEAPSDAILAGQAFVSSKQCEDGTWSGLSHPDIRMTAEYLVMCGWFEMVSTVAAKNCVSWLRETVQDAAITEQMDVSTLVLTRLAFHLCGESRDSEVARAFDHLIQQRGSYRRADNVARTYLAVFNQISFSECDPMPPEFILLPAWAPLSLARQDRWSRAIRVPLSILASLRPHKTSIQPLGEKPAPNDGRQRRPGPESGMSVAERVCLSGLQCLNRLSIGGQRQLALRRIRQWMTARAHAGSGVAGSMSATALSAIALHCLGCDRTSRVISQCFEALNRCVCPEGGIAARRVANFETALAISGLADTGVSTEEPAMNRAVESVLAREVVREGDWSDTVEAEPGGWPSELENDQYPDTACTAAMLIALRAHFAASPASRLVTNDSMVAMIRANNMHLARQHIAVLDRVAAASRRARRWLLAIQRPDGSWSSAAARSTWYATEQCDERHLSAATTGLVLQALGRWEMRAGQAPVDRGIAYLRNEQSADGMWLGSRLVDYYTTWIAVEGLLAVGVDPCDAAIGKAMSAVAARQNPDGGFGMRMPHADKALSCPLCTAWALSAIAAANHGPREENDRTDRAAQWLLDHQLPTGGWRVERKSIFQALRPKALGPQALTDTGCSIYGLLALTRWASLRSEKTPVEADESR
jgi:squalene-hopene/tetraprenyl-beta-curcumene cyclase